MERLVDDYYYLNDASADDGVIYDDQFYRGDDDGVSTAAAAAVVANMTSFPANGSDNATTTALGQFSVWYQGVHGYVSMAVCLFGIVSNAMNILVLTRRSMITPTNHILTALAIADLLTMISYLPYAVYFYCVTVPDERYGHSMGWVVYLLFNTYFTITTHTAAMWLTVALAVFRYLVVCCQQSVGAQLCSLQRAKIAITAVFIATPIFCVPHYIKHRLCRRRPDDTLFTWSPLFQAAAGAQPVDDDDVVTVSSTGGVSDVWNDVVEDSSSSPVAADTGYWFVATDYVTPTMNVVSYWLFGVVLKVVPCILLAALSTLLVRAMRDAADKRRRLLSAGRRDESERAGEHVRTTAMLVAVVLCFVATELPQGVLALLSGFVDGVFDNVYVPLADVFDVLVLVNSAVNFVLYCSMSRQFRRTFGELFIETTCLGSKNKNNKKNRKSLAAQTTTTTPSNHHHHQQATGNGGGGGGKSPPSSSGAAATRLTAVDVSTYGRPETEIDDKAPLRK